MLKPLNHADKSSRFNISQDIKLFKCQYHYLAWTRSLEKLLLKVSIWHWKWEWQKFWCWWYVPQVFYKSYFDFNIIYIYIYGHITLPGLSCCSYHLFLNIFARASFLSHGWNHHSFEVEVWVHISAFVEDRMTEDTHDDSKDLN